MPAPGLSARALPICKQLAGDDFPEAADIIWQLTPGEKTANSVVLNIISPDYWLEDFTFADRCAVTLT